MYIYVPNSEQNKPTNNLYNGFMDAINVASFIIGLENMELNITANDLAKQKDSIVNTLREYIEKLDKHLELQDRHLTDQDMRLSRLEHFVCGEDVHTRKESTK